MVFNFYELINEKEMKQTYTIVFLADLHTLYDDRIYWKQAISLVKNGYNVHYITIGDVNGKGITKEGIHYLQLKRKKYLPKLASGEWLGCFGLTEPNHGSDPSSMLTNIRDAGDHVILNGAKMWISNAPFSQVAVVWAKNEAGDIQGVIVERGMEGFSTPTTHGKWSLRASATGELVFDNVKVPKENIFPNVKGLKGPLGCLTKARYGIAWGAIGAAMDCYDTALRYSKEREQFGKPIGAFQLQQKKLAEMVTEITKAQLLNWRLGVLMNEGKVTPQQVSMAKRNACEVATNICRDARQMLGGMGITGEYPVMRHMMNLESVITYEGTHDIHLLITGMDVTGFNAFK